MLISDVAKYVLAHCDPTEEWLLTPRSHLVQAEPFKKRVINSLAFNSSLVNIVLMNSWPGARIAWRKDNRYSGATARNALIGVVRVPLKLAWLTSKSTRSGYLGCRVGSTD